MCPLAGARHQIVEDKMQAVSKTLGGGAMGRLLNRLMDSIEAQQALDRVSNPVADAVHKVTTSNAVKGLLSGAWLGHQLHPVLTDLPIGFWTSAVTLDLLGGQDAEAGADLLLAAGNLSSLGAVATGLADWSDLEGEPQRTGLVHAATNALTLSIFVLSFAARRAGNRPAGKALALAGTGTAAAGAFLGGHLVYRWGAGVTHSGFETESNLSDWSEAVPETDLTEDVPMKAVVNGEDVFLLRQGDRITAMANHCVHMGGPLNEGTLDDGAIVCPWHQSTFRLSDGCVIRGPAAMPQPVMEARVSEAKVEIRSAD